MFADETLQGVLRDLREGIKILTSMKGNFSLISVSSACALFIRHITLAKELLGREPDWKECLIKRGVEFLEMKRRARSVIVASSKPLAFEGVFEVFFIRFLYIIQHFHCLHSTHSPRFISILIK